MSLPTSRSSGSVWTAICCLPCRRGRCLSSTPREARALPRRSPHRADRHFIDVVDAPVSGGPHDVAAGALTLFVGGADDAVATVRPLLEAYGDPVLHVGPLGTGQCVKLINNLLFAAQIGLIDETVKLGGRLGISESALLQALPHGSGASNALSRVAAAGSTEAFIGFVGDFIGKDVAVIRETVAELGADIGRLDEIVSSGLETSMRRRKK